MSLQIKLVSGVLTHDTETFSNMDPYCVINLGKQSFRSKTKGQAGKRPNWNETFTFSAPDNLLKITIFDQDTATDDVVGQGTLDVSKYRNNPNEQTQFVQIFYEGQSAGKIQLGIRGIQANGPNAFGQGNPNIQPNQWGNTNQNNGWGNYGSPNQQNLNNPFGVTGQFIGQQAGNNIQPGMLNNYQAQYQMVNGITQNNYNNVYNPNNPGYNPNNPGYNPNNPGYNPNNPGYNPNNPYQ